MILAIDPGPEQSAFCFFDTANMRPYKFGTVPNCEMREVILVSHYTQAVIEEIASYGMPVGKEVFSTCVWIGRFWELVLDSNSRCSLMPRIDVKMELCKSPKANDSIIIQALKDIYGEKGQRETLAFSTE